VCVCVAQVCLDLYLMRQAAASVSAMPDVTTDWAALIDTWAVRFLHEMDYTREAANGELFRCVLQNDVAGACVVVPFLRAGWRMCCRAVPACWLAHVLSCRSCVPVKGGAPTPHARRSY
jgi:hypothetical protein